MNVFILSTGRCGSTTLERACSHITNFTAAHESRCHLLGDERVNYPDNHIESDNRLSWFLGRLDNNYARKHTLYVVLYRDKETVAKSYSKRIMPGRIIHAYTNGILLGKIPMEHEWRASLPLSDSEKVEVARDYIDTVMSNIEFFVRDKKNVIRMDIDAPHEAFRTMWEIIDAKGDLKQALSEFDVRHNKSHETLNIRSKNLFLKVSSGVMRKLTRVIKKTPQFLKDA
jgi:hypothetical protein